MDKKATYYLILDTIVGKKENGRYFLFRNGEWNPDTENMIMDRLVGYEISPILWSKIKPALSAGRVQSVVMGSWASWRREWEGSRWE